MKEKNAGNTRSRKSSAGFTVAFNGDDALLPQLAAMPGVKSVYGKMNSDVVGGGRSSFAIAETGLSELCTSVRKAHEVGLEFHYVLNSPCMGNLEMTRGGHRQICELMDSIVDAGVDRAIVALPYLLDFLKQRYPKLPVSVSTFASISTPQRARIWEDKGADRLILSQDINRNFRALETIRKAVRCELEVFANTMCVFSCPHIFTHAASNGHASSSADALKGFGVDYYALDCLKRRLSDPTAFIRGRFIRPEDIATYEEVGIDVFKLSDRLKITPWVVRTARAYTSRRYDGNLADIICYPLFQGKGEHTITKPVRLVGRSKHVSLKLLQQLRHLSKVQPPMVIDNRQLDGFLRHYLQHDCENSVCGVDCRYCENTAAKAVTVDPEGRQQLLVHLDRSSEMLVDGSAFSPNSPIERLVIEGLRIAASRKNDFAPSAKTAYPEGIDLVARRWIQKISSRF